MDQLLSSFSSIASIISFLAFIIIAIQTYKRKIISKINFPPGPMPLPIIGNIHQLISSLPHRRLADLAKKHGPVMYLQLGQVATVVVSSKQAAEQVFRTNDIVLAQRPETLATTILSYNGRDIGFAPYGDYWRQVRKLFVIHLASAKQVESFRPVREAGVAKLVGSIMDSSAGRSPVNLTKMLHSMTTSVISRATFGDSCKNPDAFASLITRVSEIFEGFSVADFFPSIGVLHSISGAKGKVLRLHQEIDDVLESIIAEYRTSKKEVKGINKSNHILGVLLDLQEADDPEVMISIESIKAILMDVFTGGIESAATVLQWTMSEIVRHPQVMRKVQAEVRQLFSGESSVVVDESRIHQLKYMKAIIKEAFRLHPPLPLLVPREARERITINGFEILPKTTVLVNAWSIGRDPEVWKDAEKFCPERFLESSVDWKGGHLELIPFGAGRRICPGMLFGISNVEVVLANLLHRFDWEVPGGLEPESLDMSEARGSAVQRKHDLCLIATPVLWLKRD